MDETVIAGKNRVDEIAKAIEKNAGIKDAKKRLD
jgi:hypothetical protein